MQIFISIQFFNILNFPARLCKRYQTYTGLFPRVFPRESRREFETRDRLDFSGASLTRIDKNRSLVETRIPERTRNAYQRSATVSKSISQREHSRVINESFAAALCSTTIHSLVGRFARFRFAFPLENRRVTL